MISCQLFLPYYTSIVLCIYTPFFLQRILHQIPVLRIESTRGTSGIRFIGDKETHIRTTSQEFDSSDFIGYLKARSEMTSQESGFTGLILIKLHKKAAATAIRYFFKNYITQFDWSNWSCVRCSSYVTNNHHIISGLIF